MINSAPKEHSAVIHKDKKSILHSRPTNLFAEFCSRSHFNAGVHMRSVSTELTVPQMTKTMQGIEMVAILHTVFVDKFRQGSIMRFRKHKKENANKHTGGKGT